MLFYSLVIVVVVATCSHIISAYRLQSFHTAKRDRHRILLAKNFEVESDKITDALVSWTKEQSLSSIVTAPEVLAIVAEIETMARRWQQ